MSSEMASLSNSRRQNSKERPNRSRNMAERPERPMSDGMRE